LSSTKGLTSQDQFVSEKQLDWLWLLACLVFL